MVRSITTGSRFRISFASWWVVWTMVDMLVVGSYGATVTQSITDSVLCNWLLAASCLLITNNMKYYLPQKERYWYVLLMSLVLSALWVFLTKTALKLIFA